MATRAHQVRKADAASPVWRADPRTVRAFLAASRQDLSLELVAAALAGYAASASHELADRLADIDADDTADTAWLGGVDPAPVVRVPAPRPPRWTT